MKIAVLSLTGLLVSLQYPLWVGHGSMHAIHRLQQQIEQQTLKNHRLYMSNIKLSEQTSNLKQSEQALEVGARFNLGMVKEGEVFYQFVDGKKKAEV